MRGGARLGRGGGAPGPGGDRQGGGAAGAARGAQRSEPARTAPPGVGCRSCCGVHLGRLRRRSLRLARLGSHRSLSLPSPLRGARTAALRVALCVVALVLAAPAAAEEACADDADGGRAGRAACPVGLEGTATAAAAAVADLGSQQAWDALRYFDAAGARGGGRGAVDLVMIGAGDGSAEDNALCQPCARAHQVFACAAEALAPLVNFWTASPSLASMMEGGNASSAYAGATLLSELGADDFDMLDDKANARWQLLANMLTEEVAAELPAVVVLGAPMERSANAELIPRLLLPLNTSLLDDSPALMQAVMSFVYPPDLVRRNSHLSASSFTAGTTPPWTLVAFSNSSATLLALKAVAIRYNGVVGVLQSYWDNTYLLDKIGMRIATPSDTQESTLVLVDTSSPVPMAVDTMVPSGSRIWHRELPHDEILERMLIEGIGWESSTEDSSNIVEVKSAPIVDFLQKHGIEMASSFGTEGTSDDSDMIDDHSRFEGMPTAEIDVDDVLVDPASAELDFLGSTHPAVLLFGSSKNDGVREEVAMWASVAVAARGVVRMAWVDTANELGIDLQARRVQDGQAAKSHAATPSLVAVFHAGVIGTGGNSRALAPISNDISLVDPSALVMEAVKAIPPERRMQRLTSHASIVEWLSRITQSDDGDHGGTGIGLVWFSVHRRVPEVVQLALAQSVAQHGLGIAHANVQHTLSSAMELGITLDEAEKGILLAFRRGGKVRYTGENEYALLTKWTSNIADRLLVT